MPSLRGPLAALLLAAAVWASAQGYESNPLFKAAQTIGARALPAEALAAKDGWPFKPTGDRIAVKAYVAKLVEGEKERAALEEGILAVIGKYETMAKSLGQPNDPATALAFSVAVLTSAAKGEPLDDQAFLALTPKFRAILAQVPATDRQKQEFYEVALSTSGMVASLAAAGGPEKVKRLAEVGLLSLIGTPPESVRLRGKETTIVPAPIEAAPPRVDVPATGAPAKGLSIAFPSGWVKSGVWQVASVGVPSDLHSALVRIVPAVPAKGSFSDALRAAWKKYVPEELADKASGMVFRRYAGDGLVTQFICGRGEEKGQRWDTQFTVYLVDCGAEWQPIVVAQTWNDNSAKFPIFSPWTISGSFQQSSPLVENLLKGLSCPTAKGKPLVDASALVGSYNYGSSSHLQYVNVYTGATSASAVSYGGTLTLLPSGEFSETYSSASGVVGSQRFAGFKAKGHWSLKGDLLTLTDTFYDQGDSYKRKPVVYRVAGVVSYADGQKVIVLKNNLDQPVNPQTVGDRSEYYSTAKKP